MHIGHFGNSLLNAAIAQISDCLTNNKKNEPLIVESKKHV